MEPESLFPEQLNASPKWAVVAPQPKKKQKKKTCSHDAEAKTPVQEHSTRKAQRMTTQDQHHDCESRKVRVNDENTHEGKAKFRMST